VALEGTFPKTKGMRSVKIRLQNSSLVGMGTPKPSAKNFEIQNGTCIVRQTISILFHENDRTETQQCCEQKKIKDTTVYLIK
jgi:hypothetical protein